VPKLIACAAAAALAASALAAQPGGTPAAAPAAPEAAPRPELDSPVTPEEARGAALRLAEILQENYADPAVGARYAAALRAKAGRGGYDAAGTRRTLATALTEDLRIVAEDRHLRVGPAPAGAQLGGGPGARPGRMPGMPQPVEATRWLAPGIAFVRLNVFPGDRETVEAARRFMADHAEARTIIFDLRTHRGGGLAEMDAIFPFLYERPTRLLVMDTRGSVERGRGAPTGESPTLRTVPAEGDIVRREHVVEPHAAERRLFDAEVIVLTSQMTFSAAEHFTLALRRTGRATLIGEPTGGGGNYGGFRAIGAGVGAFVPVGTTRDPETGARWEGNGIEPHVRVPAEQALVEALVRSGVGRAEAERLSAQVAPTGPMRRPRPAS
jgi:hypothetical protein